MASIANSFTSYSRYVSNDLETATFLLPKVQTYIESPR